MYRRTTDFEYVELTPEGQYITGALDVVPEKFVEEVCDRCEEPGAPIDPLGIFRDPAQPGSQATAHALCAEDEGWVLA